ncbi:MAG: U32 family peptidase [Candidatus Symbiothrix sp.]|jgi:putative protease|nr:U32 family peptidase [Candidatus Symbiothrix sp.]
MKTVRKIELLAPAKNLEAGIEAINHGADAVYIGAPKFSARSAAGNSLEDIQQLVDYAHIFHAKIYVALNTLLKDEELADAEQLIWDIYRTGADALIIQDMGILNLPLPPIALHASTQTDNRSIEKVQFLEETGFSQVVLARELSIGEIKDIASHTHVALEVFVHGALCTSFSGQCYISQALSGRSANRGECAQYCRLPYTLHDANGKILESNKHLLSLKDLNLSEQLEELLDAGVTSFKIEGRLKDTSYVKNTTAYYRKKLDVLFEKRLEYRASSSGTSAAFFVPDPNKSFNRGFTTYFLHGRNKNSASPDSPKSLGERIGTVKDLSNYFFTYSGKNPVHNGDGLCFFTNERNHKRELIGFRVNRVEGNKIFPADMPRLSPGITLYRNYDHEFEKTLSKKSAERKIGVELELEENNFGFSLTATDEDFYSATITVELAKELSKKDPKANIREQLSKLGNTPFQLTKLSNRLTDNWFIPSSILSDLRRKVIALLLSVRKIAIQKPIKPISPTYHPYPETDLTYRGNVSNEKAGEFYRQHKVKTIAPAFELNPPAAVPVMFIKHCLQYQLGGCPKQGTPPKFSEPLTLTAGSHRLSLQFDCRNCEMQVLQ